MGLFSKRHDPISEHERAIEAQLAEIRAQIQKAEASAPPPVPLPRLRSATRHDGQKTPAASVSEALDLHRLKPPAELEMPTAHYNELGVRKYDLVSALRRLTTHFRSGPVQKPQVVNLLAAGSIQGLRPLRYEKRVARNRCLALCGLLLFVMLAIIVHFNRNR